MDCIVDIPYLLEHRPTPALADNALKSTPLEVQRCPREDLLAPLVIVTMAIHHETVTHTQTVGLVTGIEIQDTAELLEVDKSDREAIKMINHILEMTESGKDAMNGRDTMRGMRGKDVDLCVLVASS